MVHHCNGFPFSWGILYARKAKARLTVDGDSDALAQDVSILALESRDLAELVELAVVVADTLGGLGVDQLDVEGVGLGDGEESRGTRVALCIPCQPLELVGVILFSSLSSLVGC